MACGDAVDLFFTRAAEQPTHPAVAAEGQLVTYAALARQVRCLAAALARWSAPRVLIALRPGADAYAAMLAAGLAGGYYTPVNVDSPESKLRLIAGQLQPEVIIADSDLSAALVGEAPGASVLRPSGALDAIPADGPGRRHQIAYVMFTSGSTGVPKGVVIPREALNHYVDWMHTSRMFNAADRVSQYINIGFDISVMEIYGALCAGATLFPVQGRADRLFPARMIERERITVWTSVPSVVSLMMQAKSVTAQNLASLRLLNFCGEPLLPQHLRAIFAACPQAVVQNTYGPTEATVSMTSLRMTASDYDRACRANVALGVPIPGMGLHLVGGGHPGEGEIVITGPQLATGYWQDPQRTMEAFRDVVIDGEAVFGYFTGDWAERHGDHVFFKERIDFQVKIRGVRIELDEVAAAVRDAGWPVVCVLGRGAGLAVVVEHDLGARFNERRLADALAERLEPEALPEIIRVIDRMPLNENGKIDRNAVAAWLDADKLAGASPEGVNRGDGQPCPGSRHRSSSIGEAD
jgi:D-alanine--poly(phosphoribitol) ligase subunit 1